MPGRRETWVAGWGQGLGPTPQPGHRPPEELPQRQSGFLAGRTATRTSRTGPGWPVYARRPLCACGRCAPRSAVPAAPASAAATLAGAWAVAVVPWTWSSYARAGPRRPPWPPRWAVARAQSARRSQPSRATEPPPRSPSWAAASACGRRPAPPRAGTRSTGGAAAAGGCGGGVRSSRPTTLGGFDNARRRRHSRAADPRALVLRRARRERGHHRRDDDAGLPRATPTTPTTKERDTRKEKRTPGDGL